MQVAIRYPCPGKGFLSVKGDLAFRYARFHSSQLLDGFMQCFEDGARGFVSGEEFIQRHGVRCAVHTVHSSKSGCSHSGALLAGILQPSSVICRS